VTVFRLLVVEDDPELRSQLSRGLGEAGFVVEAVGDAAAAMARTGDMPDGLVIDIGLPDADGRDLCQALRARGIDAPVLFLTARDAVSDRLAGFGAGGDDYLVKPFDVKELVARLRALLRRVNADDGGAEALVFQELRLDPARHGLVVGDRFAELTRTEYQLLELLLRNPRQVLPHDVIYDRVWGYDFGPASNALRVYVGYLRRKLEQVGARPLIATVHGVGYVLREP
jgi:two-component system response regulator MprA